MTGHALQRLVRALRRRYSRQRSTGAGGFRVEEPRRQARGQVPVDDWGQPRDAEAAWFGAVPGAQR
ncbi:uncharacterized protein FTOL_02657 [Fusarium torulosum]|uniref:Uncharacterized protein n=1 Tax=Fusarium torulosum TaxID=33205 RepID=A0AAE8SEL6_9HYPO|nr:uncharacterized protein FTOL_02657 [Fusarium torulosum]